MENESLPAKFLVDKITVFEVIVTDANVTNCSSSVQELVHQVSEQVKSLIISIQDKEMSRSELNLSTTVHPQRSLPFQPRHPVLSVLIEAPAYLFKPHLLIELLFMF